MKAGRGAGTRPAQQGSASATGSHAEALPEGRGREEAFNAAAPARHGAISRFSRLSREGWDELMDRMAEKQGHGGWKTKIGA